MTTWHGFPSAQLGDERNASVPWSSHSVRAWIHSSQPATKSIAALRRAVHRVAQHVQRLHHLSALW